MQVALAQLSTHLQRALSPLYILHGDEPLLQQEAADAIRATARAQGYTERSSYTVAGAHFDWSAVLAAGGSLSLFADKQIVEIRIPSGKPGKDGSVALQQIAESARGNDSTLTMVMLPRLDKATKTGAWFAALEGNGVSIQIDPIERGQLPQWIAQRLAQQGQRVVAGEEGQRTLQFFADRVEGNLLAAHQEIQKLALLHPAGELTQAQVEAAVLNVARYDVFKLSESVLAGQTGRVQRMLDGLQAEGEAEVLVHWALAEDIRALKRVKDAMNAGKPLPMALRENRIWGPKERLFERILPKASDAALARLLQSAHIVDGIVKGLKVPDWPQDGWQALQRLALSTVPPDQRGPVMAPVDATLRPSQGSRPMRLPNDDATNGWSAILPPRTPRPALQGDVVADWLVLGAGFAGLAAARRLAELRPHAHIVVVDAGTVGNNASGRNSGFAIDVPHNIGSSLEELRQAAHYQALLTAGMNDLELLVAQHRIDCQWRRAGKYHCAVSPAAERTLQHHVDELRALGAPHELLDRNALAARLGTRYFAAGLYTPGTVLLNPAALCRGLADALPANVTLHEQTPVQRLDLSGGKVVAHTPQGSVRAPQLLLAANGFAQQLGLFGSAWGAETFPLVTFGSLTAPLTPEQRSRLGAPEGWGVTPASAVTGATLRYTDDHRILVRQGFEYAPHFRVSPAVRERVRREHAAVFAARFPQLGDVALEHFWEGSIAITRNGAPRWGRLAPQVHGVAGCNGAGVVKFTALGALAADLALGQDHPLLAHALALGGPARMPPQPFMGVGVRAYIAREKWLGRAEV